MTATSTDTQTIVGAALPNLPWQERPAGSAGVVWRYSANPIIGWNPVGRAARIFNSAAWPHEGAFVGVFRADHRDAMPDLHFGRSRDGIHWEIEPEVIAWQDESGRRVTNSYAYDPRLLQIEDTFYITWCDDFPGPSIGLGRSQDLRTFIKMEHPLMPFNRNGVLFPRKIDGLYALLSRPSDSGHTPFGDIILSYSPDLTYWGKHRLVMQRQPRSWWQSTKIGAGPVPIETREGWLLLYHGVITNCNGFVYSMGAALLDLHDPARVLYRTRDYLLSPEMPYETAGFVPNVVFPCAALADASTGRIAIYYGAADSCTALAFCQVDELLDYMKANSELW
jgi:beta-1,4-mannooligosaccharide/beta-1,4-mannosyl-N-acetylglucosamine phosphorylase